MVESFNSNLDFFETWPWKMFAKINSIFFPILPFTSGLRWTSTIFNVTSQRLWESEVLLHKWRENLTSMNRKRFVVQRKRSRRLRLLLDEKEWHRLEALHKNKKLLFWKLLSFLQLWSSYWLSSCRRMVSWCHRFWRFVRSGALLD